MPQYKEQDEEEPVGVVEEDDLFESLTVEAVVLQRGRIKKVNSLFQQLVGYSEKDIIGKHLVDFVGPSGLAGVEQHYVNRLKGVDDISYDTVFLTDQEREIPVHVKVKTGEFQGQRAEIATFREL
jgi:PAS domain S-box-containing protein